LAVDQVLKDGKRVGCSTSRAYSPFLRKMISLGYLDVGLAKPGTEVAVLWGDNGGAQRVVRATVVELPFKHDVRRSST
jgi:vanillate/3-O-methylgallate O-demethylase